MCFNKAIVPRMFKHVVSENGPLVLILQSYYQIFIVKHIVIKNTDIGYSKAITCIMIAQPQNCFVFHLLSVILTT